MDKKTGSKYKTSVTIWLLRLNQIKLSHISSHQQSGHAKQFHHNKQKNKRLDSNSDLVELWPRSCPKLFKANFH